MSAVKQIPLFKVWTAPDAPDRVAEVLRSGYVGQGPVVDAFERALGDLWGVDPDLVVTVNSGTAALQLALDIAGVRPGDPHRRVALSPVTCTADPHAILSMGGDIVWTDSDRHGQMLRTSEADVVMPTDWGGAVALRDWSLGATVIQDAAHNLTGKRYGTMTAFSFQAIKHLNTGDGGCLLLTNRAEADEARLKRWFSLDRRSSADFRCSQNSKYPAYKWHMNDIAAAIGLANLPGALENVRRSRDNAWFYRERIAAPCHLAYDPDSPEWIYTILVERRDEFMAYMKDAGVMTSPVHAICTKHDAFPKGDTPNAEWFCARNVAIPNGFWVTDEDRERIADLVRRWFDGV